MSFGQQTFDQHNVWSTADWLKCLLLHCVDEMSVSVKWFSTKRPGAILALCPVNIREESGEIAQGNKKTREPKIFEVIFVQNISGILE